ncbi:MAG: DUF697 domain-containing protein [Planctomycetes bacterium]|nr:DUF697 domain-containing protein [Planctomycetota bacterium]
MPALTEISPNEPDVMPDYVDLKPVAAPAPEPEASKSAPEPVGLECLHMLNAELAATKAGIAQILKKQDDNIISEVTSKADWTGDSSHRVDECIPNTPDAVPDYLPESEERTATAVPSSIPLSARSSVRGVPIPRWLRRGYFVATMAIVALFGLFVFSQAVSALSQAAALPVWSRYLLLIPLGLCTLALLGICAGLIHAWLRLRAVSQIDIAALDELRQREDTRRDALGRCQAARASLEEYLRRYPLEDKGGAECLATAGCGPARLKALLLERNYLIGREVDSRDWIEDFRVRFQEILDKTAAERVNSWALKAAGLVMVSPIPLLDAVLIISISLKMIRDVAVLYNARAGGMSALVLLNRAIFAAFIAGITEEAMEKAGEMLGKEFSGVLGESALGAFGAGAMRLIGPKLGEGAINALFIRRLGKAAIRMLQPLRPKQ